MISSVFCVPLFPGEGRDTRSICVPTKKLHLIIFTVFVTMDLALDCRALLMSRGVAVREYYTVLKTVQKSGVFVFVYETVRCIEPLEA